MPRIGFHVQANIYMPQELLPWTFWYLLWRQSSCVQFTCQRNGVRRLDIIAGTVIIPKQYGHPFADEIFAFLQTTFSTAFSLKKLHILIKISLKFISGVLTGKKAALVQIRAWCRTGNKLLSEPTMTSFIDAHKRVSASIYHSTDLSSVSGDCNWRSVIRRWYLRYWTFVWITVT